MMMICFISRKDAKAQRKMRSLYSFAPLRLCAKHTNDNLLPCFEQCRNFKILLDVSTQADASDFWHVTNESSMFALPVLRANHMWEQYWLNCVKVE